MGALCLSLSGSDPLASSGPDASSGEVDRHKAPTLPRITPCPYRRGETFLSLPDAIVNDHQVGDDVFLMPRFDCQSSSGLAAKEQEGEREGRGCGSRFALSLSFRGGGTYRRQLLRCP